MGNSNTHRSSGELERLLQDVAEDEAAGLRDVWNRTGSLIPESFPESEKVQAVWTNIEKGSSKRETSRGPLRRAGKVMPFRRYYYAAAAVLLAVSVGLGYMTRTDEYSAPNGDRVSIVLRDGSSVELNSGSSLTYKKSWTGNRVVSLHGEAFFDVEHGASSFVVNTFNGEITVVGTEFNVRAWEGSSENRTSVSLYAGSLRVANRSYPESGVLMYPGETRYVLSSEASPTPADSIATADAVAWRKGDLIFKELSLQVALEDIERRFNIEVELSAVSHRQRMVSVAFRSPDDAERVINDLALALGLNYRARSDGFEIYAAVEQ